MGKAVRAFGTAVLVAGGIVLTGGTATLALIGGSVAAAATIAQPNAPGLGRDPTEFSYRTDAGWPVPFGRVAAAGDVNFRTAYDATNRYQSLFCTLAASGPIKSIVSFTADDEPTSFHPTTGKATNGEHQDNMWLQTKLGTQPQTALTSPTGAGAGIPAPGWTTNHKASGKAVYCLTMFENSKLSEFPGGIVTPRFVLEGVYGYDPRQDSTYPGGSGACDIEDPSTWVWIDNPAIAALNWIIGRWEGLATGYSPPRYGVPYASKLVAGLGASLAGIDIDAFVNAANVADANTWKVAAYPTSRDDKYEVLTKLLAACGAEPATKAGKISCIVHTELVASAVTVTAEDTAGPVEVSLGQSRIERKNAIIPRCWLESQNWEMTPVEEVTNSAWQTDDGGKRSRGLDLHYVPDEDQAAQLGYYRLAIDREPIFGVAPFKAHMRRIEPGDCFTWSAAGLPLDGIKVKCLKRSYDPMTGIVRITFRSEDDAKHTDAYEQTGTVPPTVTPDGPPDDTVDPPTLTSISVSGDTVTINWTNGEARFFRTFIYYSPNATFANAIKVADKGGDAGEAQTATHKPGPGTWYYWLVTRSGGPGAYDLSDPVALGSVVVTVEIDTDNLNDLNILRRTGGGDYTGDLDATLGAGWGTNLTGRPTELTDGRITTALNASGVLQTAIPSALADTSNLLRRTGGGLFTGALAATEGATWGVNVGSRPVELTDGRITTALNASGVLQTAIPSALADTSNLLRRTGGGLFTGDLAATVGAAWGTNLTGRPANLASLSGSEGILNSAISLSAAGVLTGAGTSVQVNLSSLPGTVGTSQVADGAISGIKLADAAVDLASAKVTGKSLANVDSVAATKLAGIEAGAQVNPANLAALDATAASDLAAAKAGVDGLGDLAVLDQVNTAQVVTNAVTVSGLASTDAQITFGENNTPVTVQTLVITTTGKPVSVRWGFYVRSKSAAGFNVQVALNRSTVPTGGGSAVNAGPDFGSYQAFELSGDDILHGVLANTVSDTPPAGTTTYTLSVTSNLGTFLTTKTAEKRVIEVREHKTE